MRESGAIGRIDARRKTVKVSECIEALQKLPPDLEVWCHDVNVGDNRPVQSIKGHQDWSSYIIVSPDPYGQTSLG